MVASAKATILPDLGAGWAPCSCQESLRAQAFPAAPSAVSQHFPPMTTTTLPESTAHCLSLRTGKRSLENLGKRPNIKAQNPKASNPELSDSKTPRCFYQIILLLYELKSIPE